MKTYLITFLVLATNYLTAQTLTPSIFSTDNRFFIGFGVQTSEVHDIINGEMNSGANPEFSYAYNLNLGYNFSKNLSLNSGIGRRVISQSFRGTYINYLYEQNNTITDENGDFIANYSDSYYSTYGTFKATLTMKFLAYYYYREPIFKDGDLIQVRIQAKSKIEAIYIPCVVQYSFGKKHTQFLIKGGITYNFIQDGQIIKHQPGIGQIQSKDGNRWNFSLENYSLKPQIKGLSETFIEIIVGFGFESRLSKRFRLAVHGDYSKSINPIFEDNQINKKNFMYNLSAGIKYYL